MTNADRISEVYRGELLDVGCSQGIASILCGRRGLRVLGVDNEEEQIEYARRDLAGEPPEVRERVRFEVGDARRLDLPDAAFDSVLLGEVLEHLDDPAPVLAEVSRVARPGAT